MTRCNAQRELEPLRPSGCANCGVFWAPMPRQGMCNACGIYLTNNKRQRPLKLAEKLQQQEPWKFRPEVPPGHMLKLKDNGKEVAVPEEDVDDSPRTDGSDSQAPSRCTYAQLCPGKLCLRRCIYAPYKIEPCGVRKL